MTFHGAGHFSVGGSAGDIYSSSSEPLFFLHHSQIDRLWTKWQSQNPSRLTEITGPILPFTSGPMVTLATILNLDVLSKNLTIADVMNTMGGALCYTYQ